MHNEPLPPIDLPPPRPGRPRLLTTASAVLALVGAGLAALALPGESDRHRLAAGWLWGFAFAWSIGLGSLLFLALHYLTHAVWSVVVKRVADMFATTIWVAAAMFVPIVIFAIRPDLFGLFPWLGKAPESAGHPIHVQRAYLNLPFFLARAAAYFALWGGFAYYFVSRSLRQDRTTKDTIAHAGYEATAKPQADGRTQLIVTEKLRSASAPFMLVFAGTLTFASIDWLMSLQPNWFSTMFGVYVFAGMMVSGLTVLALATIWLRAAGRLPGQLVRDEHLYTFGGLMFAFVSFWGYIAFSQYMLIWYANLPEESFYMVQRTSGGWYGVTVALWVVRFGIPFLVLLSRQAKMNPPVLAAISLLMLGGQLLDLFWLIMPAYHTGWGPQSRFTAIGAPGPVLGWQEIGPLLLACGLLGLAVARFMARHPLVAAGDPMLEESRRFHLH